MQTLKSVFDEVAKSVVVDAKFISRIHRFEREFVNRSEEHIAFFGGNLIGVHPMRWRPVDREVWFMDVLEIDELALEDGIRQIKSIDPNWHRANDLVNHSCIWCVHAIWNSKHLSPTQKEQACIDALLILQYKFLGSILAHYFKYPADVGVMQAVYAELSRKYAIKTAGSWGALLRSRAEEIISPRGIHRRSLIDFNDDRAVVRAINDIQGRLREIVKSITAVFYRLREQGVKIGTEKSVMEIDGDTIVKDKKRNYSTYIRYAHEMIGDKRSFVREELIKVVSDAMHTMPPRLLIETLEWMSINHRATSAGEIEELLNETLIHAFDLIASNRDLLSTKSNLTPLLTKLRALYMASRMSDPTLLKMKELTETIVNKAVKTKSSSVVASVRTGVQLYIVLRTLAMKYYQN